MPTYFCWSVRVRQNGLVRVGKPNLTNISVPCPSLRLLYRGGKSENSPRAGPQIQKEDEQKSGFFLSECQQIDRREKWGRHFWTPRSLAALEFGVRMNQLALNPPQHNVELMGVMALMYPHQSDPESHSRGHLVLPSLNCRLH